MKHVLLFSLLTASLGGCAIYPVGYGEPRGGYYQEPGYNRSEIHERSDRRDQYYDNRRYQGDNGNPFRDHGP